MRDVVDPLPFANRPVRYTDLPLPPYRFLPESGRSHPSEDPAGYLHGVEAEVEPLLEPGRWREQRSYLYGVDLYNLAYWWEAHEAWEGLWHQARADAGHDAQQRHLRGLIQLAGAMLKQHTGRPAGAEKLAVRCQANLGVVAREHADAAGRFMGVEVEALIRRVRERFEVGCGVEPALWLDEGAVRSERGG
jgi:hypothetical protein